MVVRNNDILPQLYTALQPKRPQLELAKDKLSFLPFLFNFHVSPHAHTTLQYFTSGLSNVLYNFKHVCTENLIQYRDIYTMS
jgi:hypothetical protein